MFYTFCKSWKLGLFLPLDLNLSPFACSSRESPVDCSVTKRSRHMSNDGAPMPYQASYPEPRVSPQTATPPSNATEEKRVIVPAGKLTCSHELAVTLHPHTTLCPSQDSFPTAGTHWACAISITKSEMGTVCVYESNPSSPKYYQLLLPSNTDI